jgi:hypothetical protein
MLQVASSWESVSAFEPADWCYLQLRKHISSVTRLGEDQSLQLTVRQELQRLQIHILHGNIRVAARQQHQVSQPFSISAGHGSDVLATLSQTCSP